MPNANDMQLWAQEIEEAILDNRDPWVGWSPDRSVVVVWDGSPGHRYFYKAGDDCYCDCAYYPKEQASVRALGRDFSEWANVITHWIAILSDLQERVGHSAVEDMCVASTQLLLSIRT